MEEQRGRKYGGPGGQTETDAGGRAGVCLKVPWGRGQLPCLAWLVVVRCMYQPVALAACCCPGEGVCVLVSDSTLASARAA
jgi:hypothetical protein